MGWIFRRTIRTGPIQANWSKNGIGWSLNLGICRVGINPQGTPYVSVGIPNTGLYFIKYLRKEGQQSLSTQPRPAVGQVVPPPQASSNQAILDKLKHG